MPNKTKMRVRGPRREAISALLTLEPAVEIRSQVERLSLVEFDQGFATALWDEADQRTIITVHEPDHTDEIAIAVFACLAGSTGSFEVCRDVERADVVYEFDYAS